MFRPHITPAVLLVLSACDSMNVTGRVVDGTETPIAGAFVTLEGSDPLCATRTGGEGYFELDCAEGHYQAVIAASGHTTLELELDVQEPKPYDMGDLALIRLPISRGLYLLERGTYQRMSPGRLERRLTRSGRSTHRAFCLDTEHSLSNDVSASPQALFDYEHQGWRAFRLDEEGCAYRDTRNAQHERTARPEPQPQLQKRTIAPGKTEVLLTLEAGRYFIADWSGFFVAQDKLENKHRYTGFLLTMH